MLYGHSFIEIMNMANQFHQDGSSPSLRCRPACLILLVGVVTLSSCVLIQQHMPDREIHAISLSLRKRAVVSGLLPHNPVCFVMMM